MGFRRTLLLGIGALLLFILQTGALRPWVTQIWDPIRRHIEGLLPVPAVPQPGPAAAPERTNAAGTPQPGQGNSPSATATASTSQANLQRRPTVAPDPTETAARLLAQRQNSYFALVRDYTRRVERGVALFVGSLVPGFGERHIEARNAAEAAIAAAATAAEAQRRADQEREADERGERGESAGDVERGDEGHSVPVGAGEQQQQEEEGRQDVGASGDIEGLRRRAVNA